MELIVITKKIARQTLFTSPGFNEEDSAGLFSAYLKEVWRRRAKRDWPGANVVIRLAVTGDLAYDTPLEIWGENAVGDFEDLDWQIPEYEGDALRLCEQFHAWAVPVRED